MSLTPRDILMDADLFRAAYPGWPLTGPELCRYDDDPGFAILLPERSDDEEGND